jgi:ABC-2 type transport system permease protein
LSSLIKNEIIKIFKKKSIYVMLIVTFAFTILTNVIYKYIYNMNGDYFSEGYIEVLEEQQKSLNPDNPEEVSIYINNKTDLDTYNLAKQYDKDSWQYEIILNYGRNYISDLNYTTYQDKNSDRIAEAQEKYDEFLKRINEGNWRTFAEEELNNMKKNIALSEEDFTTKVQLETLQMRLDYNIEYGNNYKNAALSRYSSNKMQVVDYEQNTENRKYREQKSYQEAKEDMEKALYVIKNDKDILNNSNLRGTLLDMFSEYELFIIITVVLIAGAIVSEEFNKGTIKLLLVKPYRRTKILFAKFIVVMLTIIFIMLAIGIMQFIVGGIFFGFDSLSIPAVEYNHNTGSIVEMNLVQGMLLNALGRLPIYILIGTLAFAISAIFTNTAVAITISILGYMASQIINQLAFSFDIAWLKYFITPNWELSQFFYGRLPNMQGTSLLFAITLCIGYFLIMIIPAFMTFKKKNIKNI